QEVAAWHDLLDAVALHEPDLSQPHDRLSWCLEPSGCFSTKSLYRAIAPSPSPAVFEYIWTIRLPLKIRIFMWQWIRGRLPSGVEVIKRRGPGDGICP
uniref:Reverse transcriptase zinc-binding domain-containing protein n=1 Tax=Aegilops tauschii subsp. strangulata TaxID=200361 RepID=A0A453KCF3_AEGTS